MKTQIIMTPEELENLKKELIENFIEALCTGKIRIELNQDWKDKDFYKVEGSIYDKDWNSVNSEVYIEFKDLIPSLQKILKRNEFSTSNLYRVKDFEIVKD